MLLAIITGAVDGVVRWDRSRYGAGCESSFVYHRANQTPVLC
nr:DUF4400 domain-containing protein [Pseudomonas gingeri]